MSAGTSPWQRTGLDRLDRKRDSQVTYVQSSGRRVLLQRTPDTADEQIVSKHRACTYVRTTDCWVLGLPLDRELAWTGWTGRETVKSHTYSLLAGECYFSEHQTQQMSRQCQNTERVHTYVRTTDYCNHTLILPTALYIITVYHTDIRTYCNLHCMYVCTYPRTYGPTLKYLYKIFVSILHPTYVIGQSTPCLKQVLVLRMYVLILCKVC